MLRGRSTAAALLAAALLAACGSDEAAEDAASTVEAEATRAAGDGGEAPAGAIDVALSEWRLEPAEATAEAGRVTFNARNVGAAPHELEVIATDTPAGEFPVESGRARIDGERIGEVEGIAGGASKVLAVDLEAGHYALVCNLPGHYEPGMYADFDVE